MISVDKKTVHIIICLIALCMPLTKEAKVPKKVKQSSRNSITKKVHKNRTSAPADVPMDYNDKSITTIINDLAARKNVNVIPPQGAHELKNTVTLPLKELVTIDEAWERLYTILDLAGYSLLPEGDGYIIKKNDKNSFDKDSARQPTRLFLDCPPSELPTTDERITYLYFLANLKMSDGNFGGIDTVMKEILPADTFYKIEPDSNSIIITGKSFAVRSTMEIIAEFDQTEYKEKMELIPLRHTSATDIAKMFNDHILKAGTPSTSLARYRADLKKPNEEAYFPGSIKLVPYAQTNSLIVMGRSQSIDRVRNFIYKYIDIELETGKSILHTYKLQYLDANTFAPILQNIVKSRSSGGTSQSTGGSQTEGASERFFKDVLIKADAPTTQPKQTGTSQVYGTNKLVITASSEDWKRVKELIEELDRPQPQVIIEVLIADLSINDTRTVANQIRNPAGIPFPEMVTAQAAHLRPVVVDSTGPSVGNTRTVGQDTLAVDLIEQQIDNIPAADITPAQFQQILNANAGATILQFADDDGKTWDILKIVRSFDYNKILSHPHIIVTNNKTATIKSGETRLVDDAANPSTAGTVVNKKEIKADLTVKITPRISSNEEVVLNIDISIDEFLNAQVFSDADKQTRKLVTNAYLSSGDILALGGLVKTNLADANTRTPLLAQIPVFGWLFKSKNDTENQTSLTVFITPTVIQPKLRSGIDSYTQDYTNIAKDYASEDNMFSGLKDPITRLFFHNDLDTGEEIDAFIHQQAAKVDMPDIFSKEIINTLDDSTLSDHQEKSSVPQHSSPRVTSVSSQKPSSNTVVTHNNKKSKSNNSSVLIQKDPHKQGIKSQSETLKSLLAEIPEPLKKECTSDIPTTA